MYKILLDEEFYNKMNQNKEYFDKLILFLLKYTDFKFVTFHPFACNANTYHNAYVKTMIEKNILKNRRLEKYDLSLVIETKDIDFQNLHFSDIFIGQIYFLHSTLPKVNLVIPLVVSKHSKNNKTCKDYIYYINHYSSELESNIRQWIKNGIIHITETDKTNLFPSKDFCDGYEELRANILKSFDNNTKRAKFLDIGFEVAERNGYVYDEHLSVINTKFRGNTRKIFINNPKTQIYLSIDFENGGFEVFDKNGKHKGQYRFNGEFDKNASPIDHNIVFKLY